MTSTITGLDGFAAPKSREQVVKLVKPLPQLLLKCRTTCSAKEASSILTQLLQELPKFSDSQLRTLTENYLSSFLTFCSANQQQALAAALGKWHASHSNNFSVQGMHYFAKAIQLAKACQPTHLKEIHRLSSHVFIKSALW